MIFENHVREVGLKTVRLLMASQPGYDGHVIAKMAEDNTVCLSFTVLLYKVVSYKILILVWYLKVTSFKLCI